MARIRSVKPELRRSLTVAAWPREVRYAWVLLWGYLDDHGRGLDDMRLLVADLFPLDRDVTEKKLDGWMQLMSQSVSADGLAPLCRYAVNGRRFIHAIKWTKSQKVSHAYESKIPPCPIHAGIPNDSRIIPESAPNSSRSDPEPFESSRTPADQGEGRREKGEGSARKRGTQAPETFDLTDGMRTWAAAECPLVVDVDRETEQMLDYHRAKGTVFKSWIDAWRNWMRKAQAFAEERGQRLPAVRPPVSTDLEWMRG